MTDFLENVFRKVSLCRHFELKVYEMLEKKEITCPTYLSLGQELIPATIATLCEEQNIKPLIFAQHRCHSTYLSFGGDPVLLMKELLGRKDGLNGGKGGSASISSKEITMFGHSGFMGDQVPIAIGACFALKKPTVCFFGDGAGEEDYVLGSLGWASTKQLPILFVCEDNDRSILTKKEVRRSWCLADVAKGFGLTSIECEDAPYIMRQHLNEMFKKPMLLNVNTTRNCWHAGSGKDDPNAFDRLEQVSKNLEGSGKISQEEHKKVEEVWKKVVS